MTLLGPDLRRSQPWQGCWKHRDRIGTIYHDGGYIKFGPDGKLYAQVGEFHQSQQAQNKSSTDGKMLRMNSDGSAPPDNPFPGSLVCAWGIRNAFGFDFDPSNNRLIAIEAGSSSDDEINNS